MRMSDEQLNRLADADEATMRVCFHGMRAMHACPENGHETEKPMFVIRLIGHLLTDHDPAIDPHTEGDVPNWNVVSIDLPMIPETVTEVSSMFAEIATQAFVCDMLTGNRDENIQAIFGDDLPAEFVKNMPEEFRSSLPPFLREMLFGDENGKEN